MSTRWSRETLVSLLASAIVVGLVCGALAAEIAEAGLRAPSATPPNCDGTAHTFYVPVGEVCAVPAGQAFFDGPVVFNGTSGWISGGFAASNATNVSIDAAVPFAVDGALEPIWWDSNVTAIAFNVTVPAGSWILLVGADGFSNETDLVFTSPVEAAL